MAYSGYELKVKAAIEERILLAGLEDQFGEILVPTESVVELKSGAKKKTERKFFPGYILIEMEMNARAALGPLIRFFIFLINPPWILGCPAAGLTIRQSGTN